MIINVRSKIKKNIMQTIEQRLESDDEFPDDCSERITLPVYLNDNRFNQTNKQTYSNNVFKNHEQLDIKLDRHEKPDNTVDKHEKLNTLHNHKKLNITQEKDVILINKLENQETNVFSIPKRLNDFKILKGALHRRDIFCLKCIESYVDDEFFLWFVNFLTLKDMHTKFKFLRSCLVYEFYNNGIEQKNNMKNNIKPERTRKYRIIVK